MKKNQSLELDYCILGAGIAGLWLLNRLKAKGYKVILLEKHAIGGMQTLAAQGIIHGGVKYSLRSRGITSATQSIAAMPDRWRKMILGDPALGDPDLSGYGLINSPDYHLWIRNALPRISGFFAERKLHHRLIPLNNPYQRGRLYKLHGEFVLHVPQLIRVLAEKHHDSIFSIEHRLTAWGRNQQGDFYLNLTDHHATYPIVAKAFIMAAGAGTAAILQQADLANAVSMQRRPLHMVMARHMANVDQALCKTFVHVIGWSDKPVLTITSHASSSGDCIWYIGGNIAEQGVHMEKLDLLKQAKKLLAAYFPINWDRVVWDTLRVDRAEPAQNKQLRPDNPYCHQVANLMICWPTKLTLMPMLADQVMEKLKPSLSSCKPASGIVQSEALLDLPKPGFALAPWEQAEWSFI